MFAKTGRYFLFICRRERIISPVWIVCIAGLAAMFAALYPGLLPTQADTVQLAAMMANPAMVAMMGNVYGMENLTQSSVMAQECLIWFLIAAAIMNIFLVNRHTRADEELGRLEMFRAMPVGRLTGALAVIKFAFVLNILISVFTAVLLIAVDLEGMTAGGAFVYSFAIGAAGLVFAALTLFGAQLFSTAHGVSGFGLAAVILFYIMRASGDVSGSALSYISPLGLAMKIEAFYTDDIRPVIVLLLESIVLAVLAFALNALRDHGAGIIPVRKGRAYASRFLRSPLGYAWRITRGGTIGWGIGLFLLGASYGSVCTELDAFVSGNEMMQKIIAQSGGNVLLDNYVAMIFVIMSIAVSVPVMLTAMKLHSEETRGRLEQVFARSVPRAKLHGSFLILAVFESLILEFLLAAGLCAAAGGELQFSELLKAGLNYLPAIWVMMGITALLVGLLPKLTALIWVMFGYTFLVMYLGRVFNVPKWVTEITPFGNIPQLPVQEFSLMPLLVLTVIAFVLTAFGVWGFTRRDIG